MKKMIFLALIAAGLLAMNCGKPAAQAQVWKCDFKGSYTEKGTDTPFKWNVTWSVMPDEKGTITGESTEEGAKSTTTGTCDAKSCKISETYTSGAEAGKSFYWLGNYTDAETQNENVLITTFSGTFGPSEADRTSGGTWSAKADCKR
ncbi:MAG: hypothetical protein K8S54_00600 [Spirochaetia bacterium]|nr:hypothetical protein [Spirochaetia bacterium]